MWSDQGDAVLASAIDQALAEAAGREEAENRRDPPTLMRRERELVLEVKEDIGIDRLA